MHIINLYYANQMQMLMIVIAMIVMYLLKIC